MSPFKHGRKARRIATTRPAVSNDFAVVAVWVVSSLCQLASWLMSRRGVAGGAVGSTHHLIEEMQGTFHYTIGPYSQPVPHTSSR
jgi:hypothetical protein